MHTTFFALVADTQRHFGEPLIENVPACPMMSYYLPILESLTCVRLWGELKVRVVVGMIIILQRNISLCRLFTDWPQHNKSVTIWRYAVLRILNFTVHERLDFRVAVSGCLSQIWIFSIPDPGSRVSKRHRITDPGGRKGTESRGSKRHRITDPQHC